MKFEKQAPKFGFEAIRGALREWALTPRYRALEVRKAMLVSLGKMGAQQQLARRIHHLPDLESLWYVRAELWTAIAAVQGEKQATLHLSKITRLFGGRVPDGMKPRDKDAVQREHRSRQSIPSQESTNFQADTPDRDEPEWGVTLPMAPR